MAHELARWRRTATAAAILVACAWLPACGAGGASDAGGNTVLPSSPPVIDPPSQPVTETPAPATPAVAVTFAVQGEDGTLRPATSASIVTNRAVYVVADWSGVATDQSEQLELMAPTGDLPFFSTTFALTPGDGVPASVQVLAGGTVRAAYRIGIWGTSIAQYQRTGTWTARVQLPDGSVAGAATIALTL